MPYIGNSHVVGDHINNFKVLDDISSYTATFDGSSTNVVSTSDETLRIIEHRFIQGQRVTYNNGGGSNIGGLTSGTAYYVTFDSANTIKLATSLANANISTNINLSSVGGGASHTLTAAFDGTNTKFKLTHNSGDSARLNNATQLQVAINNVLQRPNNNSNTFTEGYAIELGNKIVFKTAPTSNDVFWGSIIANSLPTFDIDETAIDNFTGDGSTTDFTLSRIPPNSASIIVTINGVFQHLSDNTTARAYSLDASVVKFTSAPASGDEIQVRHTGFVGATSGAVSGFYGRTGNVILTSSDHITTGDITSRNINSSGIVTASSFIGDGSGLIGVASTDNIITGTAATFNTYPVDINAGMTVAGVSTFGAITATSFGAVSGTTGTFSGNVSVGGVLTYEDVTNVDSVGIITAQKDVHVGVGLSVVGVSTLTGRIFAGGTSIPGYSGADDLTIGSESGHHGITIRSGQSNNGGLFFSDATSAGDNGTQWAGGVEYRHPDAVLRFYSGSNIRAAFDSSGHYRPWVDSQYALGTATYRWSNVHADAATIAGNATITGDLDVDGHTNLDNVSIAGFTTITQDLDVDGHTNLDNVSIAGFATVTQDLDVDGHTNLDNVSVAGVSTFADIVGITSSLNVTGITSINGYPHPQPFTVIGGSHPTPSYNYRQQFVFKTNHGHTDLKFENSYGGNWYGGSVSHTRILWEAYGERNSGVPGGDYGKLGEFCSIQPKNSTGGSFTFLDFKGNDGVVGLSTMCRMYTNQLHFLVHGNTTARVDQVGLGITGNIYHINDWTSNYSNYDTYFGFPGNDQFHLFTYNTRKLLITNSKLTLENLSAGVDINSDLDVDGHTNLDNVSIAGVTTASGNINMGGGNLIFGDSGGDSDDKLVFGAGSDFKIFHNGSNNYIDVAGNGHLYIRPKANFYIQDYTNGEIWIDGVLNGGVQLYNNGSLKLATDGSGITVHGNINMATDSVLYLGVGNDFRLFHNGTTNYIRSTNGNIQIDNSSGVPCAQFVPGQGTKLYYGPALKFTTETSGVNITGVCTATSFSGDGSALTGISGVTINNNADNRVITGSGTAATLNGESGLTYSGSNNLAISGSGQQQLTVGSTNAGGAAIILDGDSNGDGAGGDYSFIRHNTDGDLEFFARSTGGASNTIFKQGTTEKLRIDSVGQVLPGADDSQNLGSSTMRWKNIYAADMHFSNKGKTNNVDGTWGDWTLQEGEDSVFMINNRTGKKYAITMKEVN